MKREDLEFLNQLVDSLGEGYQKLEEANKRKDTINFNKIKKFLIQVQERISQTIK